MDEAQTIVIGDWVRFPLGGALVIGVVQYIRERKSWESSDTLITDAGGTSIERVLEVRHAR